MMMKYLSFVPIAIFSLALQGQTGSPMSAPAQSGQPTAAAAPVSAELTKRIDVKKAKVGHEMSLHAAVTSVLAPAQPVDSGMMPGGGAGGGAAAGGGGSGMSGGSGGAAAPAPASARVPMALSSRQPASSARAHKGQK